MMRKIKSEWLKSPRLEIVLMVSSMILAYFGLAILSAVPQEFAAGSMPTSSVAWIIFAFFMLSVAIALISVIAGIGGGVIFTPVMLAFTGVNSVIVRGAGLIVAMFSGLISTGVFIKKGLCNFKLSLVMLIAQSIGSLLGATAAIAVADNAGVTGEALMRIALGFILVGLAVYFLVGGKKLDNPEVKDSDINAFTRKLGFDSNYYEESEHKVYKYKAKKAELGIALIFLVGLIGGFFGMGGGWAITPVLNMAMGLPLKVAAANSGVILGIANCVSTWKYIFNGSIIPLFVLPWLAGQVIGGFIGSYALAKIKVKTVRTLLIGIMFFTAFGLVTKGFALINLMANPSGGVQLIVFAAIMVAVILVILKDKQKEDSANKNKKKDIEEFEAPTITIPTSHNVYANCVHWVTLIVSLAALFIPIVILINPINNYLNPNTLFDMIFAGAKSADIWATSSTGTFAGAHCYLHGLSQGDSLAQLVINIGVGVGLIAGIPTILIQIFKEKDYFYAGVGSFFCVLVVLAMVGII